MNWNDYKRVPAKKNRGKEIGKPGEGIRVEYFERPLDDGFIDALAVAHEGDLKILANERKEERLEIFERYAHVCLEEIQRQCYSGKRDPFSGLLDIIENMSREPMDKNLPGLEKESKKLDQFM